VLLIDSLHLLVVCLFGELADIGWGKLD
jgi:hypothetical protein